MLSGTQEGASDKAAVHGVVKQLCNAYILKGLPKGRSRISLEACTTANKERNRLKK